MTLVKICGITNFDDANAAAKAGAHYLGFVINYPESPRSVSAEAAGEIVKKIKIDFPNIKCTAVLVHRCNDTEKEMLSKYMFDIVQLDDKATIDDCFALKPFMEVWKSVIVKSSADINRANEFRTVADKILFDAGRGSGQQLDLSLLNGFKVDIIAGGLSLDNVGEVINKVRPTIVDINSRIESVPGKKNHNLLAQVIKKVKSMKLDLFFKTPYDADKNGYFGAFGGAYVPELLRPALAELAREYEKAKADPSFVADLNKLFTTYSGRPTPLYFAERLTEKLGGAKIYLKNEGLNHTGAHKINHCLGQALLAVRMGKKRLIAETGAGQHGLATATVAAKFGLECTVYMGAVDVARQRPNVFFMEQLGAKVVPVEYGTQRLKDAVMAALQDWTKNVGDSYYLLGSALGPHPYPSMVRDFQSIVGLEVKEQLQAAERRAPDYLIACVGGGSNAIGLFNAFLENEKVKMVGVEAGGKGKGRGENAERLQGNGALGVVEGYKSYFIQDSDGQLEPTHSVSAGLDYSGIGPEHALLFNKGRVTYTRATDDEVLSAFQLLAKTEGILPALESSHAVAEAIKLAPTLSKDKIIVVNLSGRGDKDIFIVADALGDSSWKEFLKSKVV